MCRSTETGGDFVPPYAKDRGRDRLKIRTFHLRFSISSTSFKLPETLTLAYLPRINGNPLEINGAKIRADLPSFVALHRARSMEKAAGGEAVYASADRVRAGEAVRFEVYLGSQKAVNGVFRRSGGVWGLECNSEMDDPGRIGILGAEILVGGESGALMREKVKVESERRRRSFCLKLEEIVEEGEREGCDCCCDDEDDNDEDDDSDDEEEEMEGGKWVEMGIWVMCVGVGYLGYKGLRRRRII